MTPSAAVDYRTLSPCRTLVGADGDALSNKNPEPLPDGALVFVADQRSLYRLAKHSTEPVSSPEVIATLFGASAPGRWIQLTGDRALAPLSALFFCDAGFLGVSTGSIAAPFRTVQEGINALPLTGGSILIVAGLYPDAWTVPPSRAVNLIAVAGSQGAPGGGVSIAGGTVSTGGGVRLQQLTVTSPTILLGSASLFAIDVQFANNPITQTGPGLSVVRVAGSGIEDIQVGGVTCGSFTAQDMQLGGNVNVSGTLARIFGCIVQDDIAFTGAQGLLLTDLFSLNTARGNGRTITNANVVAVDAPNTAATIAVPAFGAAGIQTVTVAFPGATPGDTFPITNVTAMPANTFLGVPTCAVADVVTVVIVALDASPGGNVDITITLLNGR